MKKRLTKMKKKKKFVKGEYAEYFGSVKSMVLLSGTL